MYPNCPKNKQPCETLSGNYLLAGYHVNSQETTLGISVIFTKRSNETVMSSTIRRAIHATNQYFPI